MQYSDVWCEIWKINSLLDTMDGYKRRKLYRVLLSRMYRTRFFLFPNSSAMFRRGWMFSVFYIHFCIVYGIYKQRNRYKHSVCVYTDSLRAWLEVTLNLWEVVWDVVLEFGGVLRWVIFGNSVKHINGFFSSEIPSMEHNENVTKIINFIKWFSVIKIKGVVRVSNVAI